MKRLPSDFTKELWGKQMLEDFRPASAEPEIEDIYKHNYMVVSNMRMKTLKKTIPFSKCATDGLIEFSYGGKTFMGIQEVKFKKAYTDWQLKQQLVQALMYEWMFEQAEVEYKLSVFILNSESYFAYVYNDEIQQLKKTLWSIFPEITETPCKAYKNKLIQDVIRKKVIPINKSQITDNYSMHGTIRDICKHCL
jgi:hypothetical protein